MNHNNKKRKLAEESQDYEQIDGANYKQWLLQTISSYPSYSTLTLFSSKKLRCWYLHETKDCVDIISRVPRDIGKEIFSYGMEGQFRRVCKTWRILCEEVLFAQFEVEIKDMKTLRSALIFSTILYGAKTNRKCKFVVREDPSGENRTITYKIMPREKKMFKLDFYEIFNDTRLSYIDECDQYLLGSKTMKEMRWLVLNMPTDSWVEVSTHFSLDAFLIDKELMDTFDITPPPIIPTWGNTFLLSDNQAQQMITTHEKVKHYLFRAWRILYGK